MNFRRQTAPPPVLEPPESKESLRLPDALFRNLFDSATLGWGILSLQGRVLAVNAALCALLDRPEQELLDSDPVGLGCFSREAASETLSRLVCGDIASHRFERDYLRPDGEVVLAEATTCLVRAEGGEALALSVQVFDVTSRRRVERSLDASQQQLASAQGIANLGSWRWDTKSGQATWSPELYRMLGVEPSDMPPRLSDYMSLIHPDDRAAVASKILLCQQTGEPYASDYRLNFPDGSTKFVHSRGRVALTDGAPTGLIGTLQDVTSYKLTELALRESEDQLGKLFDFSPIGMVMVSLDGRFLRVNRAFCSALGYSEPELLQMKFAALTHPSDVAADVAALSRLTSGEIDTYQREKRYLHKSGALVWVALSVVSIRSAAGRPTGFAVQAQDITERWRAEQALRETTALWRGILDGANYSIVATDPEGVITEFNAGAERMLGYSRLELVGKSTPKPWHVEAEIVARSEALSSELGFKVEPGIETLTVKTRRGGPDENEWTFVRKDGTRFPALLSVTALRDATGCLEGYLGIGADITERKRIERELIAAKDAAEAATHAKSQFLARVSHEIRTPMNGVIGMTDLTLQTELTAEQREYLDIVRSSARGLLHVIDDLLDFSRIEAHKLELESVEFGLRECVEAVVRELGHRARERNLLLTLEIQEQAPEWLIGDPHRLQQVLINLLGNALKFTDEGSIAVRVELESSSDTRVVLVVSVADSGVGIPLEKQALIFEAFAQAEEATTRKFGGTGLGLAICSELVEMMGGRIWVESEPGRGSTFRFTCDFEHAPLAPTTELRTGIVVSQRTELCAKSNSRSEVSDALFERPLSVLVAEDNSVNRAVVKGLLERAGHRVTLVANGLEALAAIAREAFDVVLMDVQMPELDGIEATRRLRCGERPDGARLPVIGLTAQAMSGDRQRCLDAGMDAYLSKPFEYRKLLGLMREVWHTPSTEVLQEPVATLAVFDRDKFLELLGGDVDLANEIIALFLNEVPGLVEVLARQVEQHDAPAAARTAHQLKGAISNLAAEAAASLALDVEMAARSADSSLSGRFAAFRSEFARLELWLRHNPC